MESCIKVLSEIGAREPAEVGGKGANLAALTAAGFTVPPAFCVTARAYTEFIEKAGLARTISSSLQGLDASDLEHVRRASAAIQRGILQAGIPGAIADEIVSAYRDLEYSRPESFRIAVRSSASAEDRPGLSFAGQYDTCLNVQGETALLLAVKKCWASLWSERAIVYRQRKGLKHDRLFMAVVVMEMVQASVSGVLFTANPVTKGEHDIIIHASWGLGESIVSGKTSPDEYVVEKETLTIRKKRLGEKTVMTVAGPDGTRSIAVPREQQREYCLSDVRICALASLGKQIEALFKSPQDVEWAFDGKKIFVLQSRPVTAMEPGDEAVPLRQVRVAWASPALQDLLRGSVVFWSNWNTREVFPHPLDPLNWSHFVEVVAPAFIKNLWGMREKSALYPYSFIVDKIDGRLYWNMNALYGHPFWGFLFERILPHMDDEAERLFRKLRSDGSMKPAKLPAGVPEIALAGLRAGFTFLGFPWLARPAKIKKIADRYWQEASQFERLALADKSIASLLKAVRDFTSYTIRVWAPILLVSFQSTLELRIIRRLTRKWSDIHPDRLLAGLSGDKTTEGALALFELSRMPASLKEIFLKTRDTAEILSLLEKSREGRAFLERLHVFLTAYGHRGPRELIIGFPRWKDDPSFVFQMIRSYLQLDERDGTPMEKFEAMAEERERLTALVRLRLSQGRFGRSLPWRLWLFNRALRKLQVLLPLRENPKYYCLKCYAGAARIFLEIGTRLREDGYLEAADDVYFLTLGEIDAFPAGKAPGTTAVRDLIKSRKDEHRRNCETEAPFIVRSDGRPVPYEVHGKLHRETPTLKGTAASSGRASGIARVVLDPSEATALAGGEILVTRYTDPTWTPIFLTAGALVMEVGGLLSHGAVVARECGIPAVVGVKDATRLIQTGDEITVDGTRGEIVFGPAGNA